MISERGGRRRTRWLLLAALCILQAPVLFANDLLVDRRSARLNESIAVTVSLEGDFANTDELDLPLQNLKVIGAPATSSEFSWINGTVTRRKVFRYRVRGIAAGPALVGPLVIRTADGQMETLASLSLQILPDVASGSNDPEVLLRELLATGRDPFFLVAEIDKTQAYVGEEIVVTWWLYNAAAVQEWQVSDVPKLTDFWAEEVAVRDRDAESLLVNNVAMQRLPVRRVSLYPLRGGALQVGGMTVEAAIMHRVSRGPFDLFEGRVTEIEFTSAPITVNVKPLPANVRADAIGDLALTCGTAAQRTGGPVVIDVRLAGRGNVRAATRPRFAGAVNGTVEIEEGKVVGSLESGTRITTRNWRYLIFPREQGMFEVPPLVANVFNPATGSVTALRCEAQSLAVTSDAARGAADAPAAAVSSRPAWRAWLPIVAGVLGGLVVLSVTAVFWRRLRALRRTARALAAHESIAETRAAVDAHVAARGMDPVALLRDGSERGDAYRALRSLLDALERDRFAAEERDLERRIRDLLAALRS